MRGNDGLRVPVDYCNLDTGIRLYSVLHDSARAQRHARRVIELSTTLTPWFPCVLRLLGEVANGLTLMAAVLPNFVHARSFVFPGLLQAIGLICLVMGVSKLTTHVLSMGDPGFSATTDPRLATPDEQARGPGQ